MTTIIAILMACLASLPAMGGSRVAQHHRHFETSDHVRLHYIEAGRGRPIVLVPGWRMPAWIWQQQIDDLARTWRVIALDPRGQGESDVPARGYEPHRRGADIGELLGQLGPGKVLLVGWSFGVLDSLAYLHTAGDAHLAAGRLEPAVE